MTERTRWWAEMLAHWGLSWGVIVVLIAGWFLLRRPRRAAVRYAGWLLATFAGLALLPAVIGLAPRLSWRDALARLQGAPVRSRPVAEPVPFRSWFDNMSGPGIPRPVIAAGPAILSPRSAAANDRVTASALGARRLDSHAVGDRWLGAALVTWIAGGAVFLVRLVRAGARVRALIAGAVPVVTGGLAAEAEAVRRTLGVRRGVRVMVHPEIASPLCVGLIRPVILWPTPENCPMTAHQCRAALVHEVAHLRHLDDWVALLAEVWRGAAWCFPLVHWTVARLRMERECRCDDLAAAELDDPQSYARWLLDLTPVRLATPLAASLSGSSTLAARVRRIVRGELKWARPLDRRQLVALTLLGVVLLGAAGSVRLVGLVRAAEAADAPLPEITPKGLAGRLRAAWAAYDKGVLEVAFETTANTNWRFMMNQGTAAEQEPILVRFRGRARFLGDGERWRVEYDSKMPRALSKDLNPQRWSSGFDGRQLFGWNVTQNEVRFGEAEGGAESWEPRQQFWHYGESLADDLEKPTPADKTLTIGQRTVEGVRCYVIERTYPKLGTRTEEVVSPRQGYLLIQTAWFRNGKSYHTHSLHGVREVIPGIWAPSRIVEESRAVHDDGADQLDRRTESRIVAFEPKKTFAAEAFTFEPPYGVDVTDRRLGYSFNNDPWWPEAGKLLREQFDWPKSDLTPLKSLGSPAELDVHAAPPISAAAWINSEPLDLARLRGKIVLIEFWGTWCPPCREKIPALRRLYETYHPAGLEMISIHTPTDDVDALRRFVREYRMPYPIAVDRGGEDGGITSAAYGVKGYPCAFLVDQEGRVHATGESTPNGGRLVETLIPLLEKAGARNVAAISLDYPRLSDDAIEAVSEALPHWIEATPAHGAIQGRIVDGQGQAIAGAKVTGTLEVTLLLTASPGAYHLFAPRRPVETASGNDGRFALAGLTKGMYGLKVTAPGLAVHERRVPIGAHLVPVDVEIMLAQGDTIAGMVHDLRGQPITGATINPIRWHHSAPGNEEVYTTVYTTPSGAKPVHSDTAGRYQLQRLRQGSYTLEITAPGFKSHVIETVPAGTAGANASLQRLEPEDKGEP